STRMSVARTVPTGRPVARTIRLLTASSRPGSPDRLRSFYRFSRISLRQLSRTRSGSVPCYLCKSRQGCAPAEAITLPDREADRQRQALKALLEDVDLATNRGRVETEGQAGGGGPAGVQPFEGEDPDLGRDHLDGPAPFTPWSGWRIDAWTLAPQQEAAFIDLRPFGQPERQPRRLDEPSPGLFPRQGQPLPAPDLDARDVPLSDGFHHRSSVQQVAKGAERLRVTEGIAQLEQPVWHRPLAVKKRLRHLAEDQAQGEGRRRHQARPAQGSAEGAAEVAVGEGLWSGEIERPAGVVALQQ